MFFFHHKTKQILIDHQLLSEYFETVAIVGILWCSFRVCSRSVEWMLCRYSLLNFTPNFQFLLTKFYRLQMDKQMYLWIKFNNSISIYMSRLNYIVLVLCIVTRYLPLLYIFTSRLLSCIYNWLGGNRAWKSTDKYVFCIWFVQCDKITEFYQNQDWSEARLKAISSHSKPIRIKQSPSNVFWFPTNMCQSCLS